jgi:hypothetical protein
MANYPNDPSKDPKAQLSDAQLRDLQKAMSSSQQGQAAPPTLSQSQVAALKAEVEKYHAAQRQVTDALGVLWNSQLDMAINLGQADRIESSLLGMRKIYDNCSCGGGSGPACW